MLHRFEWSAASERRNAMTARYEPLQPFFLFAACEMIGCKTFIDVGALVGTYCIPATLVPGLERCIAFEANPEAAAEVRRNIERNAVAVELRDVAVSDKPGTGTLAVVAPYSGANAILETSIHAADKAKERITVPKVTLDSLLPLPSPIALKVDVEGHEPNVLAGAARLLTENRCLVQIEDYGTTGVGEILGKLGYERVTAMGPDHYYSNIPGLPARALELYETAVAALIESNHAAAKLRPPMISRGDVTVQIGGRTGNLLRRWRGRLSLKQGDDERTRRQIDRPRR
jgi:FkbM family methyltransferase